MGTQPFLAVEGPIGVGKSSLATLLSEHLDYHLLKEIVDENPFLHKFYENTAEWSFQTEMFFLCNRYKQLEDIGKYQLQMEKPVVADYHIFKNLIFARRNLTPVQFAKYEQLYDILFNDMPKPTMVIYLTATLETLLTRIEHRGRPFEKNIDPLYLQNLIYDYDTFIDEYERKHPEVQVHRYDGDELDFVSNPYHLQQIISDIQPNPLLHEEEPLA